MAEYKGDFQQADNLYSVEEIKSKTGATDKQIMQAVQDNLDNPFGVRVGSVSGVHYSQDVLETIQKNLAEGKKMNETSEVLPKFSQGQTPRYTEEQSTLIKQEIQNIAEKWYSLEDLAKATGYDVTTLKNNTGTNNPLNCLSISIETNTHLGGYHNTQKFYSQKVLDALQFYKRQAVVNQGNRSVEQKIEIGKELSIGFLTKTVITSGDKKSAEELCNLIMHNTQETARNAELQSQVAALKPQAQIANDFIDRNHLTNFRDTSNILGITQKDLMQILFQKYIYKNSVGEYRCYAEYSKYFALRPFQKGIEKTGQQLMLTLDGLEFFKSKIFAEVKV